MIAMNYFSYPDQISQLCDINNLPEEQFLDLFEILRQSDGSDKALELVMQQMSNFKSKLDQINMDLASMGLLKKVTYEEL